MRSLLDRFRREKVPILLGTQMVAKGLDFANVTLVGVRGRQTSPSTPTTTGLPSGPSPCSPRWWAGPDEGTSRGRAIIQTWTPDNDVLHLAARQDYDTFYTGEREMRRLLALSAVSELVPHHHLRAGGDAGAPGLRRGAAEPGPVDQAPAARPGGAGGAVARPRRPMA